MVFRIIWNEHKAGKKHRRLIKHPQSQALHILHQALHILHHALHAPQKKPIAPSSDRETKRDNDTGGDSLTAWWLLTHSSDSNSTPATPSEDPSFEGEGGDFGGGGASSEWDTDRSGSSDSDSGGDGDCTADPGDDAMMRRLYQHRRNARGHTFS